MVKPDRGHDGEVRSQDIGAVKPAAEACFHHGHIDPFIREPLESQARSDLKEREFLRFEIGFPGRQEVIDIRFRDHPDRGGDLRPLAEIHQVRRGIDAGLQAGGGKGGGEHRSDGALAVGAGDMDGAESPLGMAERRTERLHTLQSRLVGRGESHLLHRRKTPVNIFHQGFVPSLRKSHLRFILNLLQIYVLSQRNKTEK